MDSINSRALKDVGLQQNGSSVTEMRNSIPKRTLGRHLKSSSYKKPTNNHLEYLTAILKNFDGPPEDLFQRKNWENWISQESEERRSRGEHYIARNRELFAGTLMGLMLNNKDDLPFWDSLLQRYSGEELETLLKLKQQFESNKLQESLNKHSVTYPTASCGDIIESETKNEEIYSTFSQSVCNNGNVEGATYGGLFEDVYPDGNETNELLTNKRTPSLSRSRPKKLKLRLSIKTNGSHKENGYGDFSSSTFKPQRQSSFKLDTDQADLSWDEEEERPRIFKRDYRGSIGQQKFNDDHEDIVIENSTPPPTSPLSNCCERFNAEDTTLSTDELVSMMHTSNSRASRTTETYVTTPKRWKNQDGDLHYEKCSSETPLSPVAESNRVAVATNLNRVLTSAEILEHLDKPDTDQEFDTTLDLDDKENFPVTDEEIDTTYPKPPFAPPLTLSIFEAIRNALDKPPKEKIVSGFSFNILQEDLQIFNKRTEWLIDRNIDFYLELIKERSKQPGYPSVYVFHSFFYTLLTGKLGDGCQAVEGTTCEDNIFEYDLVFFPVNLSHHWLLVVVQFPEKSMKCYDSMASMGRGSQIMKAIGNYLKHEYRRKFIKSSRSIENDDMVEVEEEFNRRCNRFFNWTDWVVEKVSKETIPQQNNAIDCGVFCLQYAEYLSRNEDFDFDQTHVAYFRKRMLFETLSKRLMTSVPKPEVESESEN